MRLPFAALLLATAMTASAQDAAPAAKEFKAEVRALLEKSMADKKGLMFHVNGQSIGGGVVAIGSDAVIVRNQEFGRIVIKLDAIDAVAGN